MNEKIRVGLIVAAVTYPLGALVGAAGVSAWVLKATPSQLDVWPGRNQAWDRPVVGASDPLVAVDHLSKLLDAALAAKIPGVYCIGRTTVAGPLDATASCPPGTWFSFRRIRS
jgi:hypothetical protein